MNRTFLAILVALSVAVGLGGGLLYTWVLQPVESYDAAPDGLRLDDKLVYLVLVGDLYAYDGDLDLARQRLAKLDVEAEGEILAGLVEEYLDRGGSTLDARNLAHLAEDLGAHGGVLLVFESMAPLLTPTPVPSLPPDASAETPVPAPSQPAFRLVEQASVCAEPGQPGQIAVWVQDEAGNELPGVAIVASWALGQDRFFTGLRPERGPGYADLVMEANIEYDVAVADARSDVAQGLTSAPAAGACSQDSQAGGWRLVFEKDRGGR